MKPKLHLFVLFALILGAWLPLAGQVQAQSLAPTGASCNPLTESERKELDALTELKPKGMGETEYARFIELSERESACFTEMAEGGIGISAVSGYTFNQSSGTYTEITGGTLHGTGSIDDTNYNAVSIGFTFSYNGADYTQLGINANGFVRFGGTAFLSSCSFTPISSSDTTNCKDLVSALGMDLQGNPTTGELRSETIGTAPNRVFVVQWKDFRYYGASSESFNFQIRLYETTNKIEVVYGSFTKNAIGRTPQVGIKGASNADYSNRTGSDWAASTAGGTNTATMTLNNSGAAPASGQTYEWTVPSGPPGCANIGAPADGATDISIYNDLSWSAGSGGAPTSYDVYFDTSTPPGFVVNQASSPYDPGTMAYSTTYYWQIIPKNGDGDATGCPIWSFTTEADPTVTTFPYSQNFDGSVAGWTYEDTNNDGNVWSVSTSYRRGTSGSGVYVRWNSSEPMDDWLFTPPLQLTGGTTYAVRFFYKAYSASYPESLAVDWGSMPSSTSMSGSPIFDHANFTHTTMKEAIATFTPPANGIYYVGFHGYSDADMYYLILDDVTIYDSSDSTWNWSGATDTNWYVGSNWEGGIVPGELDTVNIPSAPANQPEMAATSGEVSYGRVNNLTIENGASLALATNHNLKVEGTLTNNGSLQQTHYLVAGGSANFARITDVAGTTTKYYGVDITNTDGLPMGTTTVVVKGNQTSGCTTNPSDALLYRCYEVTPTNNQQATIRYWFTEAERNEQDSSALKLWHYDGPPGAWSMVGDTYTYSESSAACNSGGGLECWFQAQNVTTYSPFGLGAGAAPTAITLQAFGASQTNAAWFGLLFVFGMVIGGVLLVYRKRGG